MQRAGAPETKKSSKAPTTANAQKGQRRQEVENKQEKGGRGNRGAKNQKGGRGNARGEGAGGTAGGANNRKKDENRRNNNRRRGEGGGKFEGRRNLRQPQQKGGRKSNEPSPANPPTGDGSGPPHLRLPPTTSPMTTPWNRRQNDHGQRQQGSRKPGQHGGGNHRQGRGGGGGGQQEAQDWTAQPEGLTDLSRKKYSVPWLLDRRDNPQAQELSIQLPEELSLASLSPNSRARRYPFKTNRPGRGQGGNAWNKKEEEAVPAWMGAQQEDLEKDFTFKVLEEGDREHFLKYGRAKNANEVKVLSPAEHEALEKAKADAAERAHQEEFLKPVTMDDITNAFGDSTEKAAAGADPFNPDTMFAAEAAPVKPEPKPQMVIEEDIVMDGHRLKNRPMHHKPATGPQAVRPSGDPKANFLEKFMDKPNVNKPPEQSSLHRPGDVLRGPPGHGRDMANPFTSSNGGANAGQRQSSTEKRAAAMSIQANQLAYASRSATKAIRETLQELGYTCINPVKKAPELMTEEERFQEHIKKVYEDAILRANKIFYSQKYMRRMQSRQKAKLAHP